MGLSQHFQDKAGSIKSNLKNTNDLYGIFSDMVAQTIDSNITPEQENIIKSHSSPTVFHDIDGDHKTTGEKIAHAFNDPIGKSVMSINLSRTPEDFLAALSVTEESLKSVSENMPKILGSKTPKQLDMVIDSYKGLLKDVQKTMKAVGKEVDNPEEIIASSKASINNGIEYIAPLPDDYPEI